MAFLRTGFLIFINRLTKESSLENIVKFGKILYTHPFDWNSETKTLVYASFRRRLIWSLKTILVTLYSFGNCYALCRSIIMGSSQQTMSQLIRECAFAVLSVLTAVFQLNTFLHMNLIVNMFSQFDTFSNTLERQTHTTPNKPHDILGAPIKFVLYFYPFFILPQLLRSTSGFNMYHLFGGTQRIGTIIFGLLNMILFYQFSAVVLFYTKLVLKKTMSLNKFALILINRSDNPTFAIVNTVKLYRAVDICCTMFLECTSSIILTTGIFGVFIIQTLVYYCLFNYVRSVSIAQLLPIATVALLATSIAHSIFNYFNQIQQNSFTFVTMLHYNPNCTNLRFFKSILRSVRPLKITIGPFFAIKKGTFMTMTSLVSSTVVNMLLM